MWMDPRDRVVDSNPANKPKKAFPGVNRRHYLNEAAARVPIRVSS